jgi:hypothetical protein
MFQALAIPTASAEQIFFIFVPPLKLVLRSATLERQAETHSPAVIAATFARELDAMQELRAQIVELYLKRERRVARGM